MKKVTTHALRAFAPSFGLAWAYACVAQAQSAPTPPPAPPSAEAPPAADPSPAAPAVAPAPPAAQVLAPPPPAPAGPNNPMPTTEPGPPTPAQETPAPRQPAGFMGPVVPPQTGVFGNGYPRIQPFVGIVGGLKYDWPISGGQAKETSRLSSIALADFGVRGAITDWASFESEFMANGGTGLRGTSVFEGQAALQVRKQVIHLARDWWVVELGRVIDEASVDYFSDHVANTFMQDTAVRDPLLYSGFNMGNGVRATAEVLPGLRIGLAFNGGNPTSTSSTLAVGGQFPPFERVFYQAYGSVGQVANNFPEDRFHIYVVTPSLLYKSGVFEARAAVQQFLIDTNATTDESEDIKGYNARGTARLHLFDNAISPFANGALGRNDVALPNDNTKLSPDKYTGITLGGGIDLNYQKSHGNYNGVGIQYEGVQFQVGDGVVTRLHFFNVGTTYWLSPNLSIGARLASWSRVQKGTQLDGERSGMLTMRLLL
ncbi:MAG TPA: hypothetical protein VFS43_29140 [Polyangiaceae bacterium]|nr:hypothetical protein [Polyangiaceae bacterium]